MFRKLLITGHGNWKAGAGWGKVRKSGCIDYRLVTGTTCRILPAESAALKQGYIIHCSDSVFNGGSENARRRSILMPISIARNSEMAANSVSNSSGLPGSSPGVEPDRMVQSEFLLGIQGYTPDSGRIRTRPPFHFMVPTSLAPINYLSFDCIMTWSILTLFSFSRSFTSCIGICNPTDIVWMVVK